jgi:CBS domain-containing protein
MLFRRRRWLMNVRALMNPNVKRAGTDVSLADVARIMEKNDCGAIPIVNAEDRVVGMITDRDICLTMGRRPLPASEISVAEVMSSTVYACGPDEEIPAALHTMQNKKVRRLPVIDSDRKLVGILSMDDVVLHAEGRKAKKSPGLGYGTTIETLKAIYRRPGLERPLVVQP